MTVGSTGTGFIGFTPRSSNDATGIWFTTNSYSGTIIDVHATGVVSAMYTQLPYTGAQVGTASTEIQARIVSAGLRLTNISPELTTKGVGYALMHPINDPMDLFTVSDFSGFSETVTVSANHLLDTELSMLWSPYKADEMTYQDPHDGSGTAPLGAFLVVGNPGDMYYCTLAVIVEYSGINVPGKIPAHSDVGGALKSQEIVKSHSSVLSSLQSTATEMVGSAFNLAYNGLSLYNTFREARRPH